MNTKGKPTVQDVLDIAAHVEEFYQERNYRFEQDEKYYELDIASELDLPDEFKNMAVVLPTGRDMVDAYTNHIDLNNCRVSVPSNGRALHYEERQERKEKFYNALVYMTNVMNTISPWRASGKHHGLHGVGVLKHVWNKDKYPGAPDRKDDESENDFKYRVEEWRETSRYSLPIQLQTINPYHVFPDPAYGGELYVVEIHEKYVIDVLKKWPNWKNYDNKKVTEKVKFISYWDSQWRCDLIEGQPVLGVRGGVARHNYGAPPYTIIDAGLGNISIDASPEMRYVGIIRYIFDLIRSESRDYSIADTILAKTAWPWGVIEGGDANITSVIKPSFGTYVPIPAGVKITDMYPQVPPAALNDHMERTAGYIAAHAAPRASQGLSESGVRSSADRRLVLGEAALRYQYSTESFKFGTARALMACAHIAREVVPGEDIGIWANTPVGAFDERIKKEDLKEPLTCFVEFAPFSDEDDYRKHDDLIRLVASGIVNKKWARNQMSNVDPKAMDIEDEVDKLRNDPNVQAVKGQLAMQILQAAVAKRGMAMQAPIQVQSQQPGNMPMPEQPGMPRPMTQPTPNMPVPGGAQDIQNQMRAMRSPTPMTATQGRGGGGS